MNGTLMFTILYLVIDTKSHILAGVAVDPRTLFPELCQNHDFKLLTE